MLPKMLLLKGEPKTLLIEFIKKNDNKTWSVKFKNTTKIYRYGTGNLKWLQDPQWLQPDQYRVYHNGQLQRDVTELWRFSYEEAIFWLVKYQTGREAEYTEEQLQVKANCLNEETAKDTFAYMHSVASISQLGQTEAEDGFLAQIYEKIDFVEEKSAAACYLNPHKYKPKKYHRKDLIYPFGCNASQQEATTKAFEHQISVIQGPPGTGKTQTILNIIANIIYQGKTVMVVSNSNSATDNVLEKLEQYGMAFAAAPLGNHENKERFINHQPALPEELSSWKLSLQKTVSTKTKVKQNIKDLGKVYEQQSLLAELQQEWQALKLEWKHFCKRQNIAEDEKCRHRIKSDGIVRLWLKVQALTENKGTEPSNLFRRIRLWLTNLWCKHKYHTQNPLDPYNPQPLITELQTCYYQNRLIELEEEISSCKNLLNEYNTAILTKELAGNSLLLLKDSLNQNYKNGRQDFCNLRDMYRHSDDFLKQYPIVLSTTFSARTCIMSDRLFDYLIMDEASQVSVETGTLALTCAYNTVIVGDTQQLPNVITNEDKIKLAAIMEMYHIPQSYDSTTNSFLQSVCDTIKNTPQTLLREHYRCHPRIINFCNQKFYGGKLLIMTQDHGEDDVLCAIRTTKGNHAIQQYNQREIDVVKNEVLPTLEVAENDIGIITPYNRQVNEFMQQITTVETATVHKYQGREKDIIIMSAVDNQITKFADDPNLLNVAVSRAKKKFYLVVNGNEQNGKGNIQSLLDYIAYNNCSVTESKTASIFDYLYNQYTTQRMEMLKEHPQISQYASENLTYIMLGNVLSSTDKYSHLHIVCHLPLCMVIQDTSLMNEAEIKYAGNYDTHLDFLIIDKVSHKPVLAIETDGYTYHNETTIQHQRDELKNQILGKYGIPLLRLSTKGSNEGEKVIHLLNQLCS